MLRSVVDSFKKQLQAIGLIAEEKAHATKLELYDPFKDYWSRPEISYD